MKNCFIKKKFISLLLNKLDIWQASHPDDEPFLSIKIFPRKKIKTKDEINVAEQTIEGRERVKIMNRVKKKKKRSILITPKGEIPEIVSHVRGERINPMVGEKIKTDYDKKIICTEYEVTSQEVSIIDDGPEMNIYCQVDTEDSSLQHEFKIDSTDQILRSTCSLFADVKPLLNVIDGHVLYGEKSDDIVSEVVFGTLASKVLGSTCLVEKAKNCCEISTQTDLSLPSAMFESLDQPDIMIPFSVREFQQFKIIEIKLEINVTPNIIRPSVRIISDGDESLSGGFDAESPMSSDFG